MHYIKILQRQAVRLIKHLWFTIVSVMMKVAHAEPRPNRGILSEIAAEPEESAILNLGPGSGSEGEGPLIMSAGMTMKNFNPSRYVGRWFEVASLKLGFAGQGQGDCHCTQVRRGLISELRHENCNNLRDLHVL